MNTCPLMPKGRTHIIRKCNVCQQHHFYEPNRNEIINRVKPKVESDIKDIEMAEKLFNMDMNLYDYEEPIMVEKEDKEGNKKTVPLTDRITGEVIKRKLNSSTRWEFYRKHLKPLLRENEESMLIQSVYYDCVMQIPIKREVK